MITYRVVILGLLVVLTDFGQAQSPKKRPVKRLSREQVAAQKVAARELPSKACVSAGRGDPECKGKR